MGLSDEFMYRGIFETCEEGILVVSKEGRILLANGAAQRLFGYDADELKNITVENLIPAEARDAHTRYRRHYAQQPAPRKMGVGRDLMALKKSGHTFPVEISLNNVLLQGNPCTVAFIIDISERKKVEEALRKSEEQLVVYATQLENKVSERTKELDYTINRLEEQIAERKKAEEETGKALEREKELNELKSRFVSMASHEFRTPLSTILSSASLIARYNEAGTQNRRLKHVAKIKTAIGSLNSILNDFLSLSRLEEGKTAVNMAEADPRELCEEIISQLEAIKKTGQTVRLECHDRKSFRTDSRIFQNILTNLLSNAFKYSGEDTTVKVCVAVTEDGLVLTVADQGIGISLPEQQHLFERFFRAKNALNIQGTGLGLNIVKKYVEMLGGHITFESQESCGTTFTVTLPP